MNLKVLCFKLFGDFGHFRPYFTTTSPITYYLMPPTSIMGLLGAILGLDKQNYTRILHEAETKVGIGMVKPSRKQSIGINLINTKGDYWIPTSKNTSGPRTPTRFEFVVDPEYLIFVTMKDLNLLEHLAEKIHKHETYYSISLGLAWLLANYQYIAFDNAEKINDLNNHYPFSSAVPISLLDNENGIGIKTGVKYCKERYVKAFDDNRKPSNYVDAIFSISKELARFKTKEAYKLKDMFFCFLN